MRDRSRIIILMNKLTSAKRAAVVAALVEGNSMRATCRMTGVSLPTVTKLLRDLGDVCARYQDRMLRNLACERIECDEIWSFVGAKQRNIREADRHFGIGDVWTWTALDADSKLIVTWLVSGRDAIAASRFMRDLASRLTKRIQLTTDSHRSYIPAVEGAFGSDVDYATLQKTFASDMGGEARYSPAKIKGSVLEVVKGSPNRDLVSTSYVERQNLTMRMSVRRFTRLTNAFSKNVENHAAAIALHFMNYNFVRIHKTTRVTPAMAAGVSDHVWSLDELIGLLEIAEEIKKVA
jgi:IS1 family transposase